MSDPNAPPANRCDTCRHWRAFDPSVSPGNAPEFGDCLLTESCASAKGGDSGRFYGWDSVGERPAALKTRVNFGCILHEAGTPAD